MRHLKRLLILIGLCLAVWCLSAPTAEAWPGTVYGQAVYLPPVNQKPTVVDTATAINSITTETDEIACYDADTYVLLNCPFDYTILGTSDILPTLGYNSIGYPQNLANGGHYHTSGRPLAYPNNGNVLTLVGGLEESSGNLTLSGETFNQNVQVKWGLPQVGGVIAIQIDITAPPGYFCVGNCWTYSTTRYIGAIANGYYQPNSTDYDLSEMALIPLGSFIFVGNDTGHIDPLDGDPLGDFLTDAASLRFLNIVNFYVQKTGYGLRVNDMSLPAGGLFDYNQTYAPPHDTHRDGVAVDIDRTDMNGTFNECQNNYDLRKAVENTVGFNSASGQPYHCEIQKNPDGTDKVDQNNDVVEYIHINLFPQPRP